MREIRNFYYVNGRYYVGAAEGSSNTLKRNATNIMLGDERIADMWIPHSQIDYALNRVLPPEPPENSLSRDQVKHCFTRIRAI